MRHCAPAVTYPVQPARTEQALFVVLALFQFLALGIWASAWSWQWARLPAPWWLMLVGWLIWMVWWRWRMHHPLEGRLAWLPPDQEGSTVRGKFSLSGHWRWFSRSYRQGVDLAQVECVLDLQSCVLLRLRTVAGLGLWVYLEQRHDAPQWLALRRALQAHGRSEVPI
jgi:hypothetical protein